jgi:hypothetical protein
MSQSPSRLGLTLGSLRDEAMALSKKQRERGVTQLWTKTNNFAHF